MHKITVAGAGYVGLSLAVLLSQHNQVTLLDINPKRIAMLQKRISPLKDDILQEYLSKDTDLVATTDINTAYTDAEFVFIATPTNYDDVTDQFDTKSVEEVIALADEKCHKAIIVIKSTIPVGFTQKMAGKYQDLKLIFSPEFLREGNALTDNLYPSRIIAGYPHGEASKEDAQKVIELLKEGALNEPPVMVMDSNEAEAVKLFANTYLAMRVSFFNELDTYAMEHGLKARHIIDGVCADTRIGDGYNNPSFGYGGYCLPKDTKQLLANFGLIPEEIMKAVVSSNDTRKKYIAQQIQKRLEATDGKTIGIYRLTMKTGSDNFRSSAIQSIINILRGQGISMILYEPIIEEDTWNEIPVIKDLENFKTQSDIIISNRRSSKLEDVKHKVFTRDIYTRD